MRFLRTIAPLSFLAAALLLVWWGTLLQNALFWITAPLWQLAADRGGKRGRDVALMLSGAALAVALSFLALRELYLPLYPHRDGVVGAAAKPDLSVPPAYEVSVGCDPAKEASCEDARGQRLLPQPTRSRDHALLFLGCSFTHGIGLPTAETFPSLTARAVMRPAFSLAVPNSAMNEMLFKLEHFGSFAPRDFAFTDAVYTFIPHHISRAAGLGYFAFDNTLPRYVREEGKLRWVGSHFDANHGAFLSHKIGADMLQFIAGLTTSAGGFLHVPSFPREAVELAAAELNETARLFRARFGGEFYLNLWPSPQFPDRELFLSQLAPEIRVLEFPGQGGFLKSGHPDGEYHRRMADFLAAKLADHR